MQNKVSCVILFSAIFLSLSLFSTCQTAPNSAFAEIDKELQTLNSIEAQKEYLLALFADDQKLRKGQISMIMLKHGKDSPEYRAFVNEFDQQDSINLVKTERFLKMYGHPKITEVGELAAQTPWAVIHHANYEARARNFPFLQQAYQHGDIDGGAFSMYLGRMYRIKFGEDFQMESPYREEEEIEQLLQELGL